MDTMCLAISQTAGRFGGPEAALDPLDIEARRASDNEAALLGLAPISFIGTYKIVDRAMRACDSLLADCQPALYQNPLHVGQPE